MKAQAVNPYLPSYEYIPNGKLRIFDGRVYLYGSHDKFNGKTDSKRHYVCWSADENDLADWHFEGVIFERSADHKGKPFKRSGLTAPDVVKGTDGKYYFYYAVGYTSHIGVAVCDTPAGQFAFLGYLTYADGVLLGDKDETFITDPSVLVDDDGQVYLYEGRGATASMQYQHGHRLSPLGVRVHRLRSDMLTVEETVGHIGATAENSVGTSFLAHEFYRSACVRKYGSKYYLTYTSGALREVCYAVSSFPTRGFEYVGVLLDAGDVGIKHNTRLMNYVADTAGCLIKIRFRYYLFYHRHTNRSRHSRQACAEELHIRNGKFIQAELTSQGLNGRALRGIGEYPARIASSLFSRRGAKEYPYSRKLRKGIHPFFVQEGKDRNHTPNQYIANFNHGATAAFKYFQFDGANQIIITIRGNPLGQMIVSDTFTGLPVAKIRLTPCKEFTDFYAPMRIENGKKTLYFTYEGMGRFDFLSFRLQQVSRGNKID